MSLRRFANQHKAGIIAAMFVAWALFLAVVVADRWLDLGWFPTALERRARRAIADLEGPEPARSEAMRRLGGEIDAFVAVPELIRAMGSSSPSRRAVAVACLRRITNVEHGYDPDAPPAARAAAIARWKAWWEQNHRRF
jgi:hypothetical protein